MISTTSKFYNTAVIIVLLTICPLMADAETVQQIRAERSKIRLFAEKIDLGDEQYEIPLPWRGNRIRIPSIDYSRFKMIPVEHTHNRMKIYILDHAHDALSKLLAAAKEDGIHFLIESGYRSPAYQKKIFLKMINEGREFNDIIRYVAPPGYSQHALGTAVDFYPSNWSFAELEEYSWLKENGATYGFSETYPEKNELNYPWEAWHWNYLEEIVQDPVTTSVNKPISSEHQ